jgi:hypothetical protein
MRGLLMGAVALALVSCGSKQGIVGEKEVPLRADGLPVWVDQPCVGLPVGALCAVAESDFAAADVEAAKVDAETACKNRLADQLTSKVARLTERLASAMRDLASGKTYGDATLKDINQNFKETQLDGVRYVDYFFWPSRTRPRKLWVRAMITVDSNKMSQQIVEAMLTSARAEALEFEHEKAQVRFDAVRKQYLDEEKASAPAAR